MIGCAVSQDDVQVAYIAPTYQQARDIAWSQLKKRTKPIQLNVNESRLEIIIKTVKGGTSIIKLRGWEAVETLRGQYFHFIVLDEVASMRNFWIGWQEVLLPTLTDKKGSALFISTPKGFNHFYDLFNTQDKDWASFHYTAYDNPHIPSTEIDDFKRQMVDDKFFQEYMADFRKSEGLVYKEFVRGVHVVDSVPSNFVSVVAGQDFGFTNPFGAIIIGIDKDDNYWILDEEYKTQKTQSEIIQLDKILQKNYKVEAWYCDPAEPDRIEEMVRSGLVCREVNKAVTPGIDHVRSLFKENRIKIHKRCLNLLHELETYRYKDNKGDKNAPEEPHKENDHLCDSLRYALFSIQKLSRQHSFNSLSFQYDNMGRPVFN